MRGKKIVEIGCGVGLPSLAAAGCGAKALLTDQACALSIPLANAAANVSRVGAAGGSASVAPLDWGEGQEADLVSSNGPFDYVLCSDCVYANEAFDMLGCDVLAICG